MFFSFIYNKTVTYLQGIENGVSFEIHPFNHGYTVKANDRNTFLAYDSLWDNTIFTSLEAAKEFCSSFSCLSYSCIKVV